ncbi:MAG TPA: hypothetical protein VFU40_06780, partial [Gemmatimonadales bacterium]|nr:hypothetical protein [Gemmatimonadales bacterium]
MAGRRLSRGGTRRTRLQPAVQALAAVLIVGLAWVGAPRVLHRLDFFRVRRVEIAGLQYLAPAKVLDALGLDSRASVFDDLSAAGRRVRALPGIVSA